MRIIGLNNDMPISSAALIEDGAVIAAAAEERFTRNKHTRAFPTTAVDYCLNQARLSFEEIDAFAVHWNPGVYMDGLNGLLSANRRFKGEYLYSVPDYLGTLAGGHSAGMIEQRLNFSGKECKVYYITHHRCHAANAFYLSPFKEAAILTIDAQGERESVTFGVGKKNSIETIRSIEYPQSLGMLYASITSFLGYRANSDEWRVMALASYASENHDFDEAFDTLIQPTEDGFSLNLSYFSGFNWDQPLLYTPELVKLLGAPRQKDDPLDDRHNAIAAALQRKTEAIVFHLATQLAKETGKKSLCVSGGLFMNCVLNAKLTANTPFEDVFISSCPDDSGNALGAALWTYNDVFQGKSRHPQTHNYYGPEFSNDEIKEAIDKYKITNVTYHEDIEEQTASALYSGDLVGWFQGKMEFGQRALGNRSILADPRSAEMKEKINSAVKYRESYRPFAPAILEEAKNDYFEIGQGETVPFMEKAYPVREEKQKEIPAVVHVDGTARLQTVNAEANPRFHKLLNSFADKSGVPILINTSFNLNGEAVVLSPKDALRTFFSSGLDILVMGNYLIRKEKE